MGFTFTVQITSGTSRAKEIPDTVTFTHVLSFDLEVFSVYPVLIPSVNHHFPFFVTISAQLEFQINSK